MRVIFRIPVPPEEIVIIATAILHQPEMLGVGVISPSTISAISSAALRICTNGFFRGKRRSFVFFFTSSLKGPPGTRGTLIYREDRRQCTHHQQALNGTLYLHGESLRKKSMAKEPLPMLPIRWDRRVWNAKWYWPHSGFREWPG